MPLWLFILGTVSATTIGASRIISTSPRNTEILFQLGLASRIVATSTFSDYPAAAKELPVLGPLFMPSIERALGFHPDLACNDPFTTPSVFQRGLETLGIPVHTVKIASVENLFSESRKILDRVGETNFAAWEKYSACWESTKHLALGKSFRFLAFTWTNPPILFGHRTLQSDLVTKLGGINILPPNENSEYPQVAEEWLLLNPPDVVFFLVENSSQIVDDERRFQYWWPNLKIEKRTMPAEHFGRASFSPVRESWRLLAGVSVPKECEIP